MSTQTIDFNNVDSVVFNDKAVDFLKLNDLQIWESARWFTYTGIDASGNYEGTQAYDGTAVEYGIGKPTITYTTTTDTDGNETVTESISWDYCNGLNDDYFVEKFGGEYDKKSDSRVPTQVVDDILVLPSSHNGKPVTAVLPYAFYSATYTSNYDTYYQSYNYKEIVFGKNIKKLYINSFSGVSCKKISLPSTITEMEKLAVDGMDLVLEINSNISIFQEFGTAIATAGLYDYCPTVVFSSNVSVITQPCGSAYTGYAASSNHKLVFKHSNSDPIEITYTSTPKSAFKLAIYTDNDYVKNFDWATYNITPTFYSLSEWDGA